ncbi:GTP cyclohydrolase FolE2 [Salipaludibacillus sp. CUR1]|uniref:GTP cyclohydrolase FolE2 n=1 Tax=Salipaludibacillus sp. CUR1 TaxID=2820003 RepID=UPI001E408ABE|nr:GTP cyclohydrolase FolE2 [Salipaludibacillus sp. CUR1]MCE7793093.1 GTP cyclohydrolase FolE2 [Salipaludibacillus sp. CUR1]
MKQNYSLPSKRERHVRFGSIPPIEGTKPKIKNKMSDLQNTNNDFLFPLDAVGISRVKHPVTVHSEYEPVEQTAIGEFSLTTSLNQQKKGINMSRITELLNHFNKGGFEVTFENLYYFSKELCEKMEQFSAYIDISFPWFFERNSPVLEKTGMIHADCGINLSYNKNEEIEFTVRQTAAVTTLCPCSKEISEYSAHNQRGYVTIEAVFADPFLNNGDWKTMLLDAAESNASSLLYPVLKRPDEKSVTETAYENPRFVEDLTRLVAADLYENDNINAFKIQCRNEESIHRHDAIAEIYVNKLV